MTHRERIMTALKHQSPDRVPIDLGGTGSSTIAVRALKRMRRRPTLVMAFWQQADLFPL